MKRARSHTVTRDCLTRTSPRLTLQWRSLRPLTSSARPPAQKPQHSITPRHTSAAIAPFTAPPLSSSCQHTSRVGRRHASSSPSELRKTPLHELHLAHGGKMVPFAGYSMPVQYDDLSVGDSHRWTREKASLFDVGHMVQHRLSGPGAAGLLLRITPASIDSLAPHQSTLSALLHPTTGGIVDDTIVTRLGPELFYLVTNAACREKDTAYLSEQISQYAADPQTTGKVDWEILEGWGLVALQGPLSVAILEEALLPSAPSLKDLHFGNSLFTTVTLPSNPPTDILISRAGYTGEDGFEISLPAALTEPFTSHLLATGTTDRLRLAGLGARDSLRLEAGMCLYGHDLDDSTTPVEGGLGWIVGKDRRTGGGFHGDAVVLAQLRPKKEGGAGVERRRVGFVVEGAPAREGAEIVDGKGEVIGKITSGCPSPTTGKNIAMGYIRTGFHKQGTEVEVTVRGKKRKAVVTKMPFVETRYWKGMAPA